MDTKVFYKLKARKALYGFKASVYTDSIVTIGRVITEAKILDPEVEVNVTTSYGDCTVTIHSNISEVDELVSEYVRPV